MSLQVQEDAKIHLNPSSFRHLNVRTPNLNLDNVGSGGSTGFQADWFMLGKSAASYQNQLKKAGVIQNNTIQNIVDKDIFFRMNMCRYNHGTNLSNALGYFQDTETLVNTPNMQGWRGVALGSSPQRYIPPPSRIFVKNIKNGETHRGILIDISNATLDTNTSVSTPVYPLSYTLTVSSSSGEIVNTTVDVQNILENQGGLIFINDASKEIPAGEQLTVAISMTLQDLTETKNYTLNGTES